MEAGGSDPLVESEPLDPFSEQILSWYWLLRRSAHRGEPVAIESMRAFFREVGVAAHFLDLLPLIQEMDSHLLATVESHQRAEVDRAKRWSA